MRYGMNPHQDAKVSGDDHITTLNGDPSLINDLDALNAWQLVREAKAACGLPVAASFKHVSPAGVAVAGAIDDTAAETWGIGTDRSGTLLSAYLRARDADPKSSYGDVIAISDEVDLETAQFIRKLTADAIIAPGYADGAAEVLAGKKKGKFLVLEADPAYEPPEWESRQVFGVTLQQQRDAAPITADLVAGLDEQGVTDALLGMVALRYTQSNSVIFVKDGVTVGVGCGQQNRVDCVRLAGTKTLTWWLRRHPFVRELPQVDGMTRQDRLNWQVRFADSTLTRLQAEEFAATFGPEAAERYADPAWRAEWAQRLTGTLMASDGFLPFRDNVDVASEFGVATIVEPGGSIRTPDVREACAELGIAHVETGLRLFHH